jgi:hypothetical protein
MLRSSIVFMFVGGLLCTGFLTGCAPTERAIVEFSYVAQPSRGLPPGMRTIAVMPAKIGPNTDPKWSDLCATVMHNLVNEARNSYGADVVVSDRRDTQVTFDEADLAAAGMSTKRGGRGGQLLAAQGAILSNINVKVEKHVGRQRTLSGISLWGGGGHGWHHGWGHGGGDIDTSEVETVTRNMTVQTEFKLVDTGNNRIWEHYAPKTFRATDRTKASPIFGSSHTEAELTPRDAIIATLVEKGARAFISRLMPCRVDVEAEVVSSRNTCCIRGVKQLRAEAFEDAVFSFKNALADNPDDHRAAYGAGVACEASGQYDDALRFYKQACAGKESRVYREARDRMKIYGSRAGG